MFSFKPAFRKAASSMANMKSVGPIGMDIGIGAIHLCQLKPLDSDRYSVVAKAIIPFSGTREEVLTSPKRFKKLLLDGIKKKGFYGRKIVTVMPPDKLKITLVTYKSNAHDVDQEILRMLSSRVDGDVTDYLIDYLPVRSNPGEDDNLALVAIARRDHVMDYLQVITKSGFEVSALDIGPAALKRLISALYNKDKPETVLVINAGWKKSYLTIISGRRLLFDQQVDFGETLLVEHLSKTLELPENVSRELVFDHGLANAHGKLEKFGMVSDGEISHTLVEILKPIFSKLVEEINRTLIFTASETHGSPVSRVCLLGSIARWPDVGSLLRDLIDIPFSTGQTEFKEYFIEDNESGQSLADHVPELAVATGLALRGLDFHE
ncbi:MAG: pilus assembly protein PilM [Candidatus Thiodiazotropha sp. (ex Lucinoma borealis)]|nr:pilus assembly protein PilM [Candidatus Thiodiazotropha sp. (ex Lucinoma borealis)]